MDDNRWWDRRAWLAASVGLVLVLATAGAFVAEAFYRLVNAVSSLP